jgi:hypothetical protein
VVLLDDRGARSITALDVVGEPVIDARVDVELTDPS